MGSTISEKILAKASGKDKVVSGEIVDVKVDKVMMDDILGPRIEIAENLEKYKLEIWDKDRVVIISDHYTPPSNVNQANIVKFTRDWAKLHKIKNYFEYDGPCHQVMIDKGFVRPSEIIVGTDSHTCTYGGLGAFGTGIGSTEMFGVLSTGNIWFKVPETIEVSWDGVLSEGVMAKDISLRTIKELGHNGATYKAIEYVGSTIDELSIDARLCIANMGIEAGAKVTFLPQDEKLRAFLNSKGIFDSEFLKSDTDAVFAKRIKFDGSVLLPQIACPHEVDNVFDIDMIGKVKIDQAYVGSCTGGRYEDLKLTARILKNRKIKSGVRLLVSPASREIYNKCLKEGILEDIAESGAIILASSCGACLGIHSGVLGKEEVCVSSTNRNFVGRMGSVESDVYLASPISVAASAIEGYICDPRKFL